jgi:hypothetical protein
LLGGSGRMSARVWLSRYSMKLRSAPSITPVSLHEPVSMQVDPVAKHSTMKKSGSMLRTTCPNGMSSGARASAMPPPLPRTVATQPARPSWCVIFIRCASEMS